MTCILTLDQGTTGTRAALVDQEGTFLASSYLEHRQIYPRPGWVEHDPLEIWENTVQVMNKTVTQGLRMGIKTFEIKGIGIANQGETLLLWDKKTGKPLYNAIVWQCNRSAFIADALDHVEGFGDLVAEATGLKIDSYFPATKIKWLLANVDGIRDKVLRDEVAAGTIDTWLIWNLTGGRAFVTDVTTASRTMLFNIHNLAWDRNILDTLDLPEAMLPSVLPTCGDFGTVQNPKALPFELPIASSAVDQQASLFGHACTGFGETKATYGTGCFLMMNTGSEPLLSRHGLLTTVAWRMGDKTTYALEGGVLNAGSAIRWVRDGLGLFKNNAELEAIANSVDDSGGVYFVPAFSGIAAPQWDPHARGLLIGLTAKTSPSHIARATLESIAFQVRNVVEAMNADTCSRFEKLRVDGGITMNDFVMQFQADILGMPVEVAGTPEVTSLGAAFLAGLQTGLWRNPGEVKKLVKTRKVFFPSMKLSEREELFYCWNNAVQRSCGWSLA